MDRRSLTLSLELDLSEDCLRGRATDGDGAHREFSGWLGLIVAIDALVADESSAVRLDPQPNDER